MTKKKDNFCEYFKTGNNDLPNLSKADKKDENKPTINSKAIITFQPTEQTNAKTDTFDRDHQYLYDNKDDINTKYIDSYTSLNSETKVRTTTDQPYYQTLRNAQNSGESNAAKRRHYKSLYPSSHYCNSKFE
jgi:hypothetical protein